jgi:Mn-dependent DtxR family transcriptional regulator
MREKKGQIVGDAAPKKGPGPARLKVLPALTDNQAKCLLYIYNFYTEHKHFPTQREIARALGIRSNTAAMYTDPLIRKGYLVRVSERERNIRLTNDGLKRLRLMGAGI